MSPFLTRYGMERETGAPRLLVNMNLGATFDCGQLSNKIFRISRRDASQPGVGDVAQERDGYLAGTLRKIDQASNQDRSAIQGMALLVMVLLQLFDRSVFYSLGYGSKV